MNYKFRIAIPNDIQYLLRLNEVWQIHNLSDTEKIDGYLSVQYSYDDLETFIKNEEIVLTTFEEKVIGYYLLNNFCETPKFCEGIKVINEMKSKGIIDNNIKVGIGAQIVVDKEHQGKGLSGKLLSFLCDTVKHKYDLLYSSLSKFNEKGYSVHTKAGWKILYESENCHYVFLYLKHLKNEI